MYHAHTHAKRVRARAYICKSAASLKAHRFLRRAATLRPSNDLLGQAGVLVVHVRFI